MKDCYGSCNSNCFYHSMCTSYLLLRECNHKYCIYVRVVHTANCVGSSVALWLFVFFFVNFWCSGRKRQRQSVFLLEMDRFKSFDERLFESLVRTCDLKWKSLLVQICFFSIWAYVFGRVGLWFFVCVCRMIEIEPRHAKNIDDTPKML